MNWFYWSDGERIGPISSAELKRLAQTGVVSPSTTVEDETGKSALAERVSGLFVAPSSLVLASKLDGLAETLATFETRLCELTRRLERVEARVADVENKESEPTATFQALASRFEQWDEGLTAVVEKIDALTERASTIERRFDEERRQASKRGATSRTGQTSGLEENVGNVDSFELSAGKHRVGTDVPPGRYRAALRRGYGCVTAESRDDCQSYFLNTDVSDDSYNPSCVLELRSGAKLELDRPTVFTYLGALR